MLRTYTQTLYQSNGGFIFVLPPDRIDSNVSLISGCWIEINETSFLRPILKSDYNLMRLSAVSGGSVNAHTDVSKHLFREGNQDFLSFSSPIYSLDWSNM